MSDFATCHLIRILIVNQFHSAADSSPLFTLRHAFHSYQIAPRVVTFEPFLSSIDLTTFQVCNSQTCSSLQQQPTPNCQHGMLF